MPNPQSFTTVTAAAHYLGWSRVYLYRVLAELQESGALDDVEIPRPAGFPRCRSLPAELVVDWLKANHRKGKPGRKPKSAKQADDED